MRNISEYYDMTEAVGDYKFNEAKYMDSDLAKRIKSLLWRGGMMGLAVFVSFLVANIAGFGLPVWMTTVLGLVLGEVSKYLNTKYQQVY